MSETASQPVAAGPSRAVDDLSHRTHGQGAGNQLSQAAKWARANPHQWAYAGTTNDDKSNHARWIAAVIDGGKQVLGGHAEEWNATVEQGVFRDGTFVVLQDGEQRRRGEELWYGRFVAYLGPRTGDGEVG